jgi:hypothetical protein
VTRSIHSGDDERGTHRGRERKARHPLLGIFPLSVFALGVLLIALPWFAVVSAGDGARAAAAPTRHGNAATVVRPRQTVDNSRSQARSYGARSA